MQQVALDIVRIDDAFPQGGFPKFSNQGKRRFDNNLKLSSFMIECQRWPISSLEFSQASLRQMKITRNSTRSEKIMLKFRCTFIKTSTGRLKLFTRVLYVNQLHFKVTKFFITRLIQV